MQSKINVSTWMDAPQTERCYNRCCVQILCILLGGENPDTKATAAAFPQSFRPLHCLSGIRNTQNPKRMSYKFSSKNRKQRLSNNGEIAALVTFIVGAPTADLRKCSVFVHYIRAPTVDLRKCGVFIPFIRATTADLRKCSVFIPFIRAPTADLRKCSVFMHFIRAPTADLRKCSVFIPFIRAPMGGLRDWRIGRLAVGGLADWEMAVGGLAVDG